MRNLFLFVFSCFMLLTTDVFAQAFGGSVAMTDHTIFVGEGRNNAFPGSIYVYADDEKPGTWLEVQQLIPRDGFGGDQFGRTLAVHDNLLMAGMPGFDESAGAVVLFAKSEDGAWVETSRLTANDGLPDDGFGSKIASSGDRVAISAMGREEGKGAVYVFRMQEDMTWVQEAMLMGEDTEVDDGFGSKIASSGDRVAISAMGRDEGKGAVYVFRMQEDMTWVQEAMLMGDDTEVDDGFGSALSFSNGSLLVGAPNNNKRMGAAYVFTLDAGNWAQSGTLNTEAENGQFGQAVVLDGTMAYVASPSIDNRQGAVFQFKKNSESGEWERAGRLSAFDAQRNARFGSSLVLTDDALWVGAPGASRFTGTTYQLLRDESGWTGVKKLTGSDLSGRAMFASSMALNDRVAVIGATGVDGGEGAALVFEMSDAGEWNQRHRFINEIKGFDAITGDEVKCENDTAAGFDCKGVSLMSFLPVSAIGGERGIRVNDIWGWTDPQTKKEYALVGRTDGTSFVDVSDPHNPTFLGDLPKTEGSRTSVWRDIKVYKDHAYIVADGAGQHGMQVFDLSRLRNTDNLPTVFEPDYLYENIASAHNIVINESTGYAYAVGSSSGGTTCGGGLHMINIQEPKSPEFEGCFADASTGRNKTGYSHDAQCVIYQGPDTDYQGKEICFGSNETALSIADVSDKANPAAISMVSYPKVVYTHQGWLTEDQRFFYMNDEGDEPTGAVEGTRTLVWDVTDLDDPILVKEHIASTSSTDHNLYIRGDLMYQSNYDSGFRILDISTPDTPVEVGFLDTTPYPGGGGGSWSNYPYFESGTIIVTSMREGLFVVKKEDVVF